MTRLDRRRLFCYRLASLLVLLDAKSIPVVIFAFYRTAEEQKKCYDAGTSKCDGYLKRSRHQDWLAADIGILNADRTDILWDDPRYAEIGRLAVQCGLSWQPIPGDVYHVELPKEGD